MKIKVSIVDDHPIFIDGLLRILEHEDRIELLASYTNAHDLIRGLKISVPDILLLDIQMPELSGDLIVTDLLKHYPAMRIIMLTNFDSALYANNMFKKGAHGYLLKTIDNNKLVKAIQTVYSGASYIDEEMKEKIKQMDIKQRNAAFSSSSLTPREREILQLIVNGLSAPEIAEAIFLSLGTVKNYRNSIMLKLDVNNTASLVKKALQFGLVD